MGWQLSYPIFWPFLNNFFFHTKCIPINVFLLIYLFHNLTSNFPFIYFSHIFILLLRSQENSIFTTNAFPLLLFLSYLSYKLTSFFFPFLCIFLLIYILHFYFVTSFSRKLNFITLNFSIIFPTTEITTLHFCFIIIFKKITIFKSKFKKTLTFTNSHKMHISLHFISFSTICASKNIFTYNTSSLSYTSSLTTQNPQKKVTKNSYFTKIPNYPFLLPT